MGQQRPVPLGPDAGHRGQFAGARDGPVRRAIRGNRTGVCIVFGAIGKVGFHVRIEPVDNGSGNGRVQAERRQQALELSQGNRVHLTLGRDQVVQVESALKVFQPAVDGASVHGQGRQFQGPELPQVIALRKLDLVLAENIPCPRLRALQVRDPLVRGQCGRSPPLIQAGVPHHVDGDHRAQGHGQHGRQDRDAPLQFTGMPHPPASTVRHRWPKSSR